MDSQSPASDAYLTPEEAPPSPVTSASSSSALRLAVLFHDDCSNHKFIRSQNTAGLVEIPGRITSVKKGVALALSRLEDKVGVRSQWTVKARDATEELELLMGNLGIAGAKSMAAEIDTRDIVEGPFDVLFTSHRLAVNDPALLFVHPGPSSTPSSIAEAAGAAQPPWPTELQNLCRQSDSAITAGPHFSEIPAHLPQGDLYLCPGSEGAIFGALGAVTEGVDRVVEGSRSGKGYDRAFVAIRPPGHHCTESAPMGFCFVNNAAVAAAHAHQRHGIDRVIIIDIDLHHGNGTQEIVWRINAAANAASRSVASPRKASPAKAKPQARQLTVMYASLHDIYSYPCEDGDPALVQAASINLAGGHSQHISNVHLDAWTTESDFHSRLYPKYYDGLLGAAGRYCAQTALTADETDRTLLVLSAGFDASEHESAGMSRHKRNVPTSFYHRFARDAAAFARDQCAGKIVAVLEGGYSDRALSSGALATMVGLSETPETQAESVKPWWEEKALSRMERACGKATAGRKGAAEVAEPWLTRAVEIFQRLEGVDLEAASQAAEAKERAKREREQKELENLRPMQLRERRPKGLSSSADSTPTPSPTKRSVSSRYGVPPIRSGGATQSAPPLPSFAPIPSLHSTLGDSTILPSTTLPTSALPPILPVPSLVRNEAATPPQPSIIAPVERLPGDAEDSSVSTLSDGVGSLSVSTQEMVAQSDGRRIKFVWKQGNLGAT